MINQPSRKPDRPIAAVIFPKSGSVRMEQERLPQEQKLLELAIGRKFVGAISHFEHGRLSDLMPGEEPADVFCTSAEGARVGIQITEIIDSRGAIINSYRRNYLSALHKNCADTLAMCSGCYLTVMDNSSEDFFIRLNTTQGRELLDDLAEHFTAFAQEVHTLGLNKQRTRIWKIGPSQKTIHIHCIRRTEAGPGVGYDIHWNFQRPLTSNELRGMLTSAIQRKLTKNYQPPDYEFWLLMYTTDMLYAVDDASIALGSAYLDHNPHPFGKVWFFFPYHGRNLGHTVLVWQRS